MTTDRRDEDDAFFGEECGDLVHPDWAELLTAMGYTQDLKSPEYITFYTHYDGRQVKLWPTGHWELA